MIGTGVMVMKDGKAWGKVYEDGYVTEYGWTDPTSKSVKICDPRFCTEPTDVTYSGSLDIEELSKGEVVAVVRATTVTVLSVI